MDTYAQRKQDRRPWWDHAKVSDEIFVTVLLAALAADTILHVVLGRDGLYIAELFLLPVLMAAFRYGIAGGLASGALAALLAGPLAFEIMQPRWAWPGTNRLLDWLLLLVCNCIVGAAVGTAFRLLRRIRDEAMRTRNYDRITGLPNLEGLRWQLSEHLAATGRHAPEFSKYAIRINNYQSLVNAFGYHFADAFMRQIASNVCAYFPPPNLVARVSPSTLAIVREGRPDPSLQRCRQLRDMQLEQPVNVEGIPVYPEISIGVAWSELDQPAMDHLFSNAELAATEARYTPERIILYSPIARSGQRERIELLGSFGPALSNGHIRLEYQPKLDVRTQRLVSVEALARWNDPRHGAIPPTKFIPLLEETRIINTLTTWVMHEAIRQIRTWRDKGVHIDVSINVSARNFDVPETFSGLGHMLDKYGIEGSSLEMEITETSFIHLTDRKLQTIAGIRDLGVRMAIDDFGTGYASLSYLRQLPIDVLKLDSTFVNEGLEQPHDLMMVKRMVQIAKDRNLLVVAEGVEHATTLRAVQTIGVDQAQGHFISKALPPEEIEELFQRWNKDRPGDAGPEIIG